MFSDTSFSKLSIKLGVYNLDKQCIMYQAGPKTNCTWEAFITSCCYLSWQLIRWYILLDEARSLQGDSLITGVWNREQKVFTWTKFHRGKFWKHSNLPHASFGWKPVKQRNILNSGCLSDSSLSATQTLHKNELSHDKNREILKAGGCSWMFWFVTARDAWERLLTRLASTQSETERGELFQLFLCTRRQRGMHLSGRNFGIFSVLKNIWNKCCSYDKQACSALSTFLVFTDVMLTSDRYSDTEALTASVGVGKPLVALMILIKSVVFSQCNVSLCWFRCFLKALFCTQKKVVMPIVHKHFHTNANVTPQKKPPFYRSDRGWFFSFCLMTVAWNSRLVHFLQQHHPQSLTSPLSVSQHQVLFDKLDTNYIDLWNHPTDILNQQCYSFRSCTGRCTQNLFFFYNEVVEQWCSGCDFSQ